MKKQVADFLALWKLTNPPIVGGKKDRNYLSPCYEQLIGAGYALYKAEVEEFEKNDYNNYYVDNLHRALSDLVAMNDIRHRWWQMWLNGFYFNAGLHRIVWAYERLLAIFGYLPDIPKRKQTPTLAKSLSFREIKDKFFERLREMKSRDNNYKPSGLNKAYCFLKKDEYLPIYDITDDNVLNAIRWRVNIQKHAIEGLQNAEEYKKEKNLPKKSIVNLKPHENIEYALKALKIVCEVYEDVNYYIVNGFIEYPEK